MLHGGSSAVIVKKFTAVQMATSVQVSAPESFDFSKPQEWERWIRRFERFRIAGRDCIVVGIRDFPLSEKLQLDSTLTLETAIAKVRQSKTVKSQQTVLRGGPQADSRINALSNRMTMFSRSKHSYLPISSNLLSCHK